MQKKRTLWSQAGQKMLRELPLKPWAACRREDLLGLLAMSGRADREAGRGGAEGGRGKSAGQAADDATGSGTEHGAGVRADHRRCDAAFPRGKQVASYLGLIPREESSGGRQKLGAISKQGNRLLRIVAGGSGAERGALRSAVSQTVFASLSSEAERRGQGGSGAQVGRTTLLDAAHQDTVSRDRSHREQPAGAPGRRKLDRMN